MRDETCFQDWETVVLKKPTLSSTTAQSNQPKCKIDDNEMKNQKKFQLN